MEETFDIDSFEVEPGPSTTKPKEPVKNNLPW